MDLDTVYLERFAEPEVDPGIVGCQVAPVASHPALHRCTVLPKQLDHASVSRPVGANSLHMNQEPMPALWNGVQQQARRTVVVGEQNIDTTVVIHVAKNRGSADVGAIEGRAG